MNETYQNLKELSYLHEGTTDLNEIALQYQNNEDAILLSYAYCKLFSNAYSVSQQYYGLTEDDLASFSLEELHKAMMNYEPGKGAKLATLYSRYLQKRLRTETQANNYDKRKANSSNVCVAFQGELQEDENTAGQTKESTTTNTYEYKEDGFNQIEILMDLAKNGELTEREYAYCEIIVNQVTDLSNIKDSEIAQMLQITSAGVNHVKKSLQRKIGVQMSTGYSLNF